MQRSRPLVLAALLLVSTVVLPVVGLAGPAGALAGPTTVQASTTGATITGTITAPDGDPAADAHVLVGPRERLANATPAELRALAESPPESVAAAETSEDGRYRLNVTDEVVAEVIVAVGPTGVSEVIPYDANRTEYDLGLYAGERLRVDDVTVEAEPGGRVTFTLSVENTGEMAVEGLQVKFSRFPRGWNVVATRSADGDYVSGNRTFVFDRLAPGETAEAEVRIFVAIDAETGTREFPLYATSRTHPVRGGTLTVDVAYPEPATEAEVPGFGPAVAALAVALAGLALSGRRD